MKRNFDLKRRESKNLPYEKLHEILSTIYPQETVEELMTKFVKLGEQEQTENNIGKK